MDQKRLQDPQHIIEHTKRPVLAEFYTDACVPCHELKPVLDQIEREYTGMLKVVRIDAEQYQNLVLKYNVGSVPFLILFEDGKIESEYADFIPYKPLKQMLDKHL